MGKVCFIWQIPRSQTEGPDAKAGYNQLRLSVSAAFWIKF